MYRHPLIGISLLLAACTGDITTADRDAFQSQQSTQVLTTIPFAGRCETSFVFTGQSAITIASVCQMRGIGRVTGVTQQILDFSQIAVTGLIGISNTSVYPTPNGDQLFATFTGTGTQAGPDIALDGVETITGGTGRFTGASGSALLVGAASLVTSTGHYTTTGTVTR